MGAEGRAGPQQLRPSAFGFAGHTKHTMEPLLLGQFLIYHNNSPYTSMMCNSVEPRSLQTRPGNQHTILTL